MCVSIYLPDSQTLVERQDELSAVIDASRIERREGYDDEAFGPECCLCSIDIPATFANAGFWVTNGWEWDGNNGFTDWVAIPASAMRNMDTTGQSERTEA